MAGRGSDYIRAGLSIGFVVNLPVASRAPQPMDAWDSFDLRQSDPSQNPIHPFAEQIRPQLQTLR